MDNQNAGADNQSSAFGGDTLVTLTTDIVSAYVGSSQNHIAPADIPGLITSVHAALGGLTGQSVSPQEELRPAVSIRSSVKPDYIVCLEDGKRLKMLKRYLNTKFGMTPDQYRAKWGLPADYPMVAPNYAEQRRQLAKDIGLGTKRTRSTEGRATATAGRGRKAASTGNGRRKPAVAAAPKKTGRGRKAANG